MRKSLLDVGVTKLNLDGNQIILEGVLGYGSSSIVYEGIYIEKSFGQEFEHKIVLKEFFPLFKDHEESDAFRNDDGTISFPDYIKGEDEYKRYLTRFKNAHKIITDLNNQKLTEEDLVNGYGLEGNGTYYQQINLNHGVTLDKFLEKCQDLKILFNVMKKVAQAINHLHAIGIIHMDIKPSNIFVRENTNNIKLIDVDSFVFLNEAEENETNYVYSATPKYASPQVNNLLRNPGSLFVIKSAINTKSDIYSVAAIVYEAIYGGVLTNLVKKKSDIPQVEEFIREKYPHYSMNAIRKLEEFFYKSLAFNISKRYDSMSDVVEALDELEKLFNPKEVFIKDNFIISEKPLFGRQDELEDIENIFKRGKKRLFLTGIPGIGKSAVAKRYALEHIEDYDIILESHCDTLQQAIMSVPINGWINDNKNLALQLDKIEELGENKKILFIMHDYDTREIDGEILERLNNLKCNLLITSRCRWELPEEIHLNDSGLPPEEAKKLFKYYAPKVCDSDDLEELLKYIQYHPLLIVLLAKQITFAETTPSEVIHELKDSGIEESEYELFQYEKDELGVSVGSVYKHLKTIYAFSAKNLSPKEKEALRYMTIVGTVAGISREDFCEICNFSKKESLSLDLLERKGWITKDGKYFNMHLGIAEILAKEDEIIPTVDNIEPILQYLKKNSIMYRLENEEEVITELVDLKQKLLYRKFILEITRNLCLRVKEEETVAYIEFLNVMCIILKYVEDYSSCYKEVAKRRIDVSKKMGNNDIIEILEMYYECGMAHHTLKDTRAIYYFEEILEMYPKAKYEVSFEIIEIYECLFLLYGHIYDQEKDLEYKIKYQEKGLEYKIKYLELFNLEINKEIPEGKILYSPVELASSYLTLGMLYFKNGDYNKSHICVKRSIKISKENLPYSLGILINSFVILEYMYVRLENDVNAMNCYNNIIYYSYRYHVVFKTLDSIINCLNSAEINAKKINFNQVLDELGNIDIVEQPLEFFLKDLCKAHLLNYEKEINLFKQMKKGYQDAKYMLLESHKHLVVSIANEYINKGVLVNDLIKAGNLGLIEALNRFDYSKEYEFSSYSIMWIREYIVRAVEQAKTTRVSESTIININKIYKTAIHLERELGRSPTIVEISKKLDMTKEQIEEILKIPQESISII